MVGVGADQASAEPDHAVSVEAILRQAHEFVGNRVSLYAADG